MKDTENKPVNYKGMDNDVKFRELFGEEVGRGRGSVVYARGDKATKVYRKGYSKRLAFSEAMMMATIEELGLPTTKIYSVREVEGHFALEMSRAKGKQLLDAFLNEDTYESAMATLVDLQLKLHNTHTNILIPLVLMLKGSVSTNVALDGERKAKILKLIDTMPDGDAVCHCDFHPANVIVDRDSYTIIDFLECARGNASADACRTYLDLYLLSEKIADDYLNLYCKKSGAKKEAILAWLPIWEAILYKLIDDKYSQEFLNTIDKA